MFVLIKCDTCRVGTSLEEVYEFDDNFDFDYIDNIEFPNDFSVKVIVDSKWDVIKKLIILKIRSLNKWKK